MNKQKQGLWGRRDFFKRGGAGLAGAALLGAGGAAEETPSPRLTDVGCPDCVDERGVGKAAVVRRMVHEAVRALSGKETLAEAWGAFVKPDDVVGVKINVRAGRNLSVQPCVVDAIVEGVKAAGVAGERIIVWDAWNREFRPAGYTINESGEGVQYFGSDHGVVQRKRLAKEEARALLKPYYAEEPVELGGKPVWLTKILTEQISALINVPLIKHHQIAGVTLAMKNHYGSILNPSDLHGDHCSPYLAELNAVPAIRDKTRLVVVDGLRGLYEGGPYDKPPYRFQPKRILASADPVAADAYGLALLERVRQDNGLPPIGDEARHVRQAAELGVGECDLGRVDVREIALSAEA